MNKLHEQAEQLFLEMVKVDSPSFSESNMVDYLVEKIKTLKWNANIERLTVYKDKYPEDALIRLGDKAKDTKQLVVIVPATDDNIAPIYFCAHIDTVEPGNGIKPIVENGIVRTDGTTVLGGDDKSGVASIIAAVDSAIKQNKPHGKLVLIFSALEEEGHLGAKQVDINKYGVKYGYVFDTVGRIGKIMQRSQHSQTLTATIEVTDIPNHAYGATVPNALSLACDLIAKIDKKLYDKDDMTFVQITSLTTDYDAGNMVPRKAAFKITVRSFVKDVQRELVKNIMDMFDAFVGQNAKLTYTITPKTTAGYNHTLTEDGKNMMKKAERIITEMKLSPEYITMGLGGHDASTFIERGVPSLVLSCGMQNIHTTSEYLELKDLDDCAELILRLIENA